FLRKLRARLLELDLEGRALDAKERRAGLDRVALGEELRLENAGDARAHLDLARAFRAAHGLEGDGHRARRDRDGAHRNGAVARRRLGRPLLLRAALAAGGDDGARGERGDSGPPGCFHGALLLHGEKAFRKQSTIRSARRGSGSPSAGMPKSRLMRSCPTSMPVSISAANSGSSRRSSPSSMARSRRAARRRTVSPALSAYMDRASARKRAISGTSVRKMATPWGASTRLR